MPLLISNFKSIAIRSYMILKAPMSNISKSRIIEEQSVYNDLSDMRKPYRDQDDGLEEEKLPSKNPVELFEAWFNAVKESKSVYEPNAFCICTSDKTGQPSARMVLLKGFGKEGFRFFTHYTSQKGRNIEENPKVSMLFYWDAFNRQVRVEGEAKKLNMDVAEAYFAKRPLTSQIGAAISDQCGFIKSREELMQKYTDLEKQVEETKQPPPKPSTWGGYIIIPNRFEFWQGNTNRVHDRIIFQKSQTESGDQAWIMKRMLP